LLWRPVFSSGGEGRIRTHGAVAHTTVFETVPFNHSGTSPSFTCLQARRNLARGLEGGKLRCGSINRPLQTIGRRQTSNQEPIRVPECWWLVDCSDQVYAAFFFDCQILCVSALLVPRSPTRPSLRPPLCRRGIRPSGSRRRRCWYTARLHLRGRRGYCPARVW
jgi:hypothetical protein